MQSVEGFSRRGCVLSTMQTAAALVVAALLATIQGCGSGGYAGSGVTSLSASRVTIDAGQSFTVTATDSDNLPLTWSLSGGTCSGAACGTLSSASGLSNTYTAPAQVTAPLSVSLTSSVAGTQTGKTVAITVNPAPVITGTTPSGTVGTPYTATLTASGGTGTLRLGLQSGSLPTGLTFNTSSGVISGTPLSVGTSTFVVQAVDASDVPYTATATRQITIGAQSQPLAAGGTPPAGTVGVAYSAPLQASGGTAPYTWTVTSGAPPSGLALSSAGVISGTPTAAGTYTFAAQVQDTNGGRASANVSIAISAGAGSLAIAGSLPAGTVGSPYTASFGVTGGTAPYTCTVMSGSLPAGLSITSGCSLGGTPTVSGTSSPVIRIVDSSTPQQSASATVTLTVNAAASPISVASPAAGSVGAAYTGAVPVSGGTAPYTCSISGGALPAGLSLSTNCQITGTPTTAGTTTATVSVTDSSSPVQTGNAPISITINPGTATLALGAPPAATVNAPYSGTVPVVNGNAPYSCAIAGGTLPSGLTLSSNCAISGTPTQAGTSNVTITATDSSSPALTGTNTVAVVVNGPTVTLTVGTPPPATVNTPYSGTVPVSGGTGPYTCALRGGALPAGLTLGGNCQITGTPSAAGSASATVEVTDASNPPNTGSGPVVVTVNASSTPLTLGAPPAATVNAAYSAAIPVADGTAPYSCTLAGGTLPAGLALGANCVLSGTPTATANANITVTATDSGNPARTGTGVVPVVVNAATANLTVGTLPYGTVGTAYSSTIPVSGGTAPYACTITGALPAGLTLAANCQVSGTPTAAGSSTVTINATDSTAPARSGSGTATITIAANTTTLTLGAPAAATVNTPYSGTIPVTGGTAPYGCTLASGTLPAGLTLGANCVVSGTPTTAGTSNITVNATDSSTPTHTGTGAVPISVQAAAVTLTLGTPAPATVNTPYSGSIPVSNGTGPYTCSLTAGTLPAGLALGTNCQITGTPTVAGTTTVNVQATDSAAPANTGSGSVTLTVSGGNAATLTIANPAAGTVATPYTSTIPVSGGTAPYNCTVASGALPAGLTLGANCALNGTPTVAGATVVGITATDSANTPNTQTSPVTITVQALQPLTLTGTLPNAVVGQAYTQTLNASGGVAPYTYAVTAGALPTGLTLSSTGQIAGTPTTAGAASFTVTATDAESTAQTAALPLVLLVTYPATPNDALLQGPYAFLVQGYDDAVLGALSYRSATVGSFSADGAGVLANGKFDSNHQILNPTGNTVATQRALGTYTVGSDLRGTIALTTLNADGTTGATNVYTLALHAPVSPSTTAASGNLIQSDSNQFNGTKATGTLLQQTQSALAAGLSGTYAYGLSGDTPCLPSCAVGLGTGPVAQVGSFTAGGGTISSGTADTNVADGNVPSTPLSGTYAAADTNGRVQLSLNTSSAGLALSSYPTDFAVYVVDANRALILSTDKHSAYILQAGTATLQTQATFGNAALTGPFVGYETTPVNPGLVQQTLNNVLNYSSATIFQGAGDGNGNCTFNRINVGGVSGLTSALTGLGSSNALLNAVLGNYQTTGTAGCSVAASGRAVLNYVAPDSVLTTALTLLGLPATPPAPRVAYLTAPNAGYFLETGYAGLGTLEAQAGAPFSLATLNGSFLYGTVPPSTVATVQATGTFTADGTGNATSTTDLNAGVGTLNVLQLGLSGAGTYTISNTDTPYGRFFLNPSLLGNLLGNTQVIYAIVPGRFVLLNADPLTTSPYIALLY